MTKSLTGTAIARVLGFCLLMAGCEHQQRPVSPVTDPAPGSFQTRSFSVQQGAKLVSVPGAVVTSTFFSSAKAFPVLGRAFIPEEFGQKGFPVVVISYRFWKEQFDSDPAVIGRAIQVDGRQLIVVGI